MDFMPLRLNFSSLTCSICALAVIMLQLVAMVDSPIVLECAIDIQHSFLSLLLIKILEIHPWPKKTERHTIRVHWTWKTLYCDKINTYSSYD